MPQAAENNIRNAGQFAQAAVSNIAELIEALLEYLERNAQLAPQKALAKWIKDGGSLVSYPIQGHCKAELKYEMEKNGIAYVETTTGYLIIPEPSLDKVRELNREILVSKGNYFQEVDGVEMENAIAKFDRIENKDIFSIHGLNKYETEVLKNKCNNISAGFMVGISKEGEDSYELSVHGNRLYNPDVKKDFCKAYLQMAFSLYGPNREIKVAQIEADEKIDNDVQKLKSSEDVHYIVGADDENPKKFIEINSNGFEFYESSIVDEKRVDRQVCRIDKNDPNYESELARYMDRIFNKVILHNTDDLGDHLAIEGRNLECDRPRPDYHGMQVSMAADKITDTIDKMVKTRMQEEGINFLNVNQAFTYYQKEAADIMESIERNTVPANYPVEGFREIKKICEEHQVSISEFSKSKEVLMSARGEIHKAVVRDISKQDINTDKGVSNVEKTTER